MVMSTNEALTLIAAAQEVANNGGEVPTELRCQYPSKRCDNVRTTKRGGGLHRLCSFHRQRANKNQWLVDQRRRLRRERDGSLITRTSSNSSASPKSSPTKAKAMASPASPSSSSASSDFSVDETIMDALDIMDIDAICAPLGDNDLQILQALLFDEDDDELSKLSDLSDGYLTDTSMDWAL